MSSSNNTLYIHDGWVAYQSLPDVIGAPSENCFDGLASIEASVPGSLHNSLKSSIHSVGNVEDYDWWYSCDFTVDDVNDYSNNHLVFECLATLAEVWLNGNKILSSNNMFLASSLEVASTIKKQNTLIICFRSVSHFLKQKRPRPKWKTNLVNNQQLRWLRTSLLGRMPGWTPSQPALGPCGKIKLVRGCEYLLQNVDIKTRIEAEQGIVSASINISGSVESAFLIVENESSELTVQMKEDGASSALLNGEVRINQPELWWPCTHGEQSLYACQLKINSKQGEEIIDLGDRAFRTIEMDTADKRLQLRVNNKDVFVRGVCWTIADIQTFFSSTDDLRSLLTHAHDANINMLRVGGTMTYEQDDFYRICDELGIMVWQDFMFANMDYPVDEPDFLENITAEVNYQLMRLSQYASVIVYCGNSEVQQQAAMVGVDRENWSNHFFDSLLPQKCAEYSPGSLYFPSTPYGGALPFHITEGLSHFYGVGAYKKSLLASGLRDVKFTTETLGFSHVPEPRKVDAIFNGNHPVCHSPIWKQGIPRDMGAGWDFEDIRDHYLEKMFGVNPVTLRSTDTLRYLALSRVVTGELIKLVISHWRSPDTPCSGALLWFYKDLVPGAGWGLLDDQGNPKSAYHYIKRAFQPLAVFLVDKGLDGLDTLVINDTPAEQHLRVNIKLLSCPNTVIEQHSSEVTVAENSYWVSNVESLLGYFRDVNYSYQFGVMQYQLVSIQVMDVATNELVAEDTYFPSSLHLNNEEAVNINASLAGEQGNQYLLIQSDRFLQAVYLDIPKLEVNTNYFHLLPDTTKKIPLPAGESTVKVVKGYITALNLSNPVRLNVK